MSEAEALHEEALIWDAHSCMPLHPDADLGALERHKAAGVDFVSVNVGMDMNPLPQILTVLASFRAQLRARAEPVPARRDPARSFGRQCRQRLEPLSPFWSR